MRVPTMLLLITVMFLVSSAAVFVRPVVPLLVESFTDTSVERRPASSSPRSPLTSAIAAVGSGRVASARATEARSSARRSAPASATRWLRLADTCSRCMLLMALVGVFSGAMIPMVNALIGAHRRQGKARLSVRPRRQRAGAELRRRAAARRPHGAAARHPRRLPHRRRHARRGCGISRGRCPRASRLARGRARDGVAIRAVRQ